MKDFFQKRYKLIFVAISLLSLIPLMVIAIYSRPSADDYSYARFLSDILHRDHSIFELIIEAVKVDIHAWKSSDGPYISQFFMTLHPGIFGEKFYGLGAMGIMFFSIVCMISSFRTACECAGISKRYGSVFGSIMSAIIFTGMPNANEGLFWYDGAVNYTPFYFLVFLEIALVLKMLIRNERSVLKILAVGGLTFLASGGNFIVTYLNLLLIFTISIYAFLKKRYVYISLFAVALLGFCLEFFAPGTRLRTVSGFEHPSIMSVLFSSIKGCYVYICEWTSIQWLMLIVIVALLALEIISDDMLCNFRYNPVWIIIYIVLIMCALLCLPYYANGGTPTGRILNVIWAFYMLLSAIFTFYLVGWLKNNFSIVNKKSYEALAFIGIICMLFAVGYNNSNSIKASRELLNGTAKEFARLNDIRYEMMESADEGDELECPPLIWETILYFEDLSEDPEDWKNVAWKKYYGIGMHVVKD